MSLVTLLVACTLPAAQKPDASATAQDPNEVPELTLNLPDAKGCDCGATADADYTFLDKGFAALVAGDHIEAVQYFQRYQRLESSPLADWEAGIAIAYDSILTRSPFYDPDAARKSYRSLKKQAPDNAQVHDKVLLMRDSLEAFMALDRQIADLKSDNAILREDVKKREEALKRLRELALGQKAARP
tara:strand:- start:29967 stop:30527 length:561 start_codon:yes stop_codon:yes gene_type:complete